jgi:DNA-binding NtrC family response regulator
LSAHVLIADDEALIRQSIRMVLVQEGFDVTVAASGAEAWARFREERPDIVLLDLVLGDADGLDLLRRMRAESSEVKVLLISAHGSIESAVTAMKLGGYDFIKKPFELEEVVAAVRNAARTSSLEQRVAYLAAQERKRASAVAFVHASPRMKRRAVRRAQLFGDPREPRRERAVRARAGRLLGRARSQARPRRDRRRRHAFPRRDR